MTEEEWLTCVLPYQMLHYVRGDRQNRLPERRSRLFCVACCYQISNLLRDERSIKALQVTERYSDGIASSDELSAAYEEAFDVSAHYAEHPDRRRDTQLQALGRAANAVGGTCHPDEYAEGVVYEALHAARIANIVGENVTVAKLVRDIFGNPFRPVAFDPAWRTDTAIALARTMYDQREFSTMPILADALQDAGCDNADILHHCRGDGPHVRGCWVVDLVLGKE